jgi:hypothetical protein
VESLTAAATGADRVEVPGARGGEAGLDHVDLQALELLADAHLLVARHGRARALLAVAHGGVENDQLVAHGVLRMPDGLARSRVAKRLELHELGGWGF